MSYNDFKCADFLEDTSFQSYLRKEKEEDISFWENWQSEHPENINEFNQAKAILGKIIQAYSHNEIPDKEQELSKLKTIIQLDKETRESYRQYRIAQLFKYVAFILLITGVGFLVKIIVTPKQTTDDSQYAYKEITVPKGKRLHLVLTDGTQIWVNSESKFRFPNVFKGNDRKVYLEGEAYFVVTHDKSKPFYVYASDVRVKVLGTAFNVRSYPEDHFVETTLERGKVNIERLGKGFSEKDVISLIPNQKVTLYNQGYQAVTPFAKEKAEKIEKIESKNAIIVRNVKTELYTSWKDEKLIFKSEPLLSLKSRLERWYNKPIVIKDNDLFEKRFTGTFVNEPINQALKALSVASELEFEIKNDTVYLMKNK